jgi:hypothetical protein
MDLDRSDLREIGVTKVGDQIRIHSQAKKFRTKEYKRVSKILSNRVCKIYGMVSCTATYKKLGISRSPRQPHIHPSLLRLTQTTLFRPLGSKHPFRKENVPSNIGPKPVTIWRILIGQTLFSSNFTVHRPRQEYSGPGLR